MAETTFYQPHLSQLDSDGTLHVRASYYDDDGHSSVVREIHPTESDYSFWRWLIEQNPFQRSLDDKAMAEARLRFDRHRRSV